MKLRAIHDKDPEVRKGRKALDEREFIRALRDTIVARCNALERYTNSESKIQAIVEVFECSREIMRITAVILKSKNYDLADYCRKREQKLGGYSDKMVMEVAEKFMFPVTKTKEPAVPWEEIRYRCTKCGSETNDSRKLTFGPDSITHLGDITKVVDERGDVLSMQGDCNGECVLVDKDKKQT